MDMEKMEPSPSQQSLLGGWRAYTEKEKIQSDYKNKTWAQTAEQAAPGRCSLLQWRLSRFSLTGIEQPGLDSKVALPWTGGWNRGLMETPSNLKGSVCTLFENSSHVQTPTIVTCSKLIFALAYFSFCLTSHSIRQRQYHRVVGSLSTDFLKTQN